MTDQTSRLPEPADVTRRLNALSAAFPGHDITADYAADDTLRYTARNRHEDVHPRLVVTRDIAELYAVLGANAG